MSEPHFSERRVRLTRLHQILLYATFVGLWVSGGIWWLRDGMNSAWLLKIHGAAAMAFMIVFGTLLMNHVPVGWKQRRQRPSGSTLVTLCVLLVATGWGLYYAGNEDARKLISDIHCYAGLAAPVVVAVHIWGARRRV